MKMHLQLYFIIVEKKFCNDAERTVIWRRKVQRTTSVLITRLLLNTVLISLSNMVAVMINFKVVCEKSKTICNKFPRAGYETTPSQSS